MKLLSFTKVIDTIFRWGQMFPLFIQNSIKTKKIIGDSTKTKKVIARESLILLSTAFVGLLIVYISQLMLNSSQYNSYEKVYDTKNMLHTPTYNIYNYNKIITVDYYLDDGNFGDYRDDIIKKSKYFPKLTQWEYRDSKGRLGSYTITNVRENKKYQMLNILMRVGIILLFIYPIQYLIRLVLWAIRTLKTKRARRAKICQ